MKLSSPTKFLKIKYVCLCEHVNTHIVIKIRHLSTDFSYIIKPTSLFIVCLLFEVLGIKLSTSCLLGKCSPTEPHPQLKLNDFFLLSYQSPDF